MKLQKPMRWKEGMFLRPQHFQQYDLYLENREFSRFQALERFGWGLLNVEVDEEALSNFTFDLKRLTAVLPEGALIDVPGNARIGRRSFDALMKEIGFAGTDLDSLTKAIGTGLAEHGRDALGSTTDSVHDGGSESKLAVAVTDTPCGTEADDLIDPGADHDGPQDDLPLPAVESKRATTGDTAVSE